MAAVMPVALETFVSTYAQFNHSPAVMQGLYKEVVAWVLVQVRGLVPQYRAAGVPLIAHVEQTGRTLRVVSGKAKADGGFEPCTLAALVLTGLENDNGNPVNQALNLTMYAHGGLSINPEGLYAIGRRYEESVV